ncbi:MAG: hypothetical protein Q9159_006736 [Coniocarpon cinnabarinum]
MALAALSHGRSALVVYGSESGTAQDAAEEIGRVTKRLRFRTSVTELDMVNLNDFVKFDVVILAVSTTGQGDVPTNARSFWKKLRSSKLKTGVLSRVCFTSFGIGDSSYPNFNWASRKLSNRLLQLSAHCFCERGESDEQHIEGVDGLFIPWLTTLHDSLLQQFPLPAGQTVISDEDLLMPEWKLQMVDNYLNDYVISEKSWKLDVLRSRQHKDTLDFALRTALLASNGRLTPEAHWQDVRLFEFSVDPVDYSPGDVLTIFPRNATEDVDELISIMHWESIADRPIEFVPDDYALTDSIDVAPPLRLGASTTLRDLITNYLDLNAIPRRSFFTNLAHFTSDPMQKERLLDFTKPELLDELYDYTTRPRRSILEVLQEFDTVKIPWQWAASIFPHIKGRQFSIASGGNLKQGPNGDTRIQLLVAIVRYRTIIKKLRQGLCTRYLSELEPGSQLEVGISRSGMRIDLDKPAIMVGPGTGVAPLRAMVHERAALHPGSPRADQLLFFGGRNREADFFFQHEWARYESRGNLTVHTAFSRDQSSKVYVQDVIHEHARDVYRLLNADGVVYICGSSGRMPQAVRAALTDVIETQGRLQREDAERYLTTLEKSGRYQQETW